MQDDSGAQDGNSGAQTVHVDHVKEHLTGHLENFQDEDGNGHISETEWLTLCKLLIFSFVSLLSGYVLGTWTHNDLGLYGISYMVRKLCQVASV